MDPQRDDLLVVRAVEDADPAPLGSVLGDAPQEGVVELLGRRLLERDDLHALRVDARHDVLDRRVLAGRVHRLEDDQQRVGVARPQQLLRVLSCSMPSARTRLAAASSFFAERRSNSSPPAQLVSRPARLARVPGATRSVVDDVPAALARAPPSRRPLLTPARLHHPAEHDLSELGEDEVAGDGDEACAATGRR